MTRPAPLARNLGWAAEKFFAHARQLAREGESLMGGHRIGAGRGLRPIRIARDGGACRPRRDTKTDGRSPWRAAEPARPSRGAAPARGRRATAPDLRVDARRAREQFHRRGAGAGGRRQRMFGAGHDVPQGSARPSKLVASVNPTKSAAICRCRVAGNRATAFQYFQLLTTARNSRICMKR